MVGSSCTCDQNDRRTFMINSGDQKSIGYIGTQMGPDNIFHLCASRLVMVSVGLHDSSISLLHAGFVERVYMAGKFCCSVLESITSSDHTSPEEIACLLLAEIISRSQSQT